MSTPDPWFPVAGPPAHVHLPGLPVLPPTPTPPGWPPAAAQPPWDLGSRGPMPPPRTFAEASRRGTRARSALKVAGIVVGVTLAVVGMAAIGLFVLALVAFSQSGSNQ